MKLKKSISIILLPIMFFLLAGCDKKNIQTFNSPETDMKIVVTINPEINVYTPLMSSTPGIPLNANIKPNIKAANFKLHWIAEQGTFLNLKQDNGKITILGNNIKNNAQKLYWSVDPNEKMEKTSFKIYLKIEDNSATKVLAETSIQIEQNKEGFFSIKK